MGASQSARTETEEEKKIHRRNFRRKSVGGSTLQFIEQHPAVDIASRLTIALERATLRAERAEAEVLALMGDDAKPSPKDEVQCSICLEKLPTDRRKRLHYENEGVQLLQCRHVFHRCCIQSYLRSRGNQCAPCPICRTLDAACFKTIESVRGPRLPLPPSRADGEEEHRHHVWHTCLGEHRSRPVTDTMIDIAMRHALPIQMRGELDQQRIPTALELTQKVLAGIAEDDDV